MGKTLKNSNKGITLIALVITIIVLLILAAVTISTLTGDNGILNNATNSKEQTEIGEDLDQIKLAVNASMIDSLGDGVTKANLESNLSKQGLNATVEPSGTDFIVTIRNTAKNTERKYKVEQNGNVKEYVPGKGIAVGETAPDNTTIDGNVGSYSNPTIPKGFKAVEKAQDSTISEEAKWGTETGYQYGLVIEDATEDSQTNGSQFVWVPVNDYDNNFHLIEGYYNLTLDSVLDPEKRDNPSREAGSNDTSPYTPGKPNAANTTVGTTESKAMYKSVKDNGGFYIARYEAGIISENDEDGKPKDNYKLTEKKATDGKVKPLSRSGLGVWNSIVWGGTSSNTLPNDGLPGNDTADGAVKVARSMYNNPYTGNKNAHTTVKSTLCYGVQWDAVMNFIDSNYVNRNANGYVKNSTDKGNYTGTIVTTGSSDDYAVNNIYDMAGNVFEWTMEACDTDGRVIRGGSFGFTGSDFPASSRISSGPDDSSNALGFRVALYL